MIVRGKQGSIYVQDINMEIFNELKNRFETNYQFLNEVGITRTAYKNIMEGNLIRLETVVKILDRFDDITPEMLVGKLDESDYQLFKKMKYVPSRESVVECSEYVDSLKKTIKLRLDTLPIEKVNYILGLVNGIIIESQYLGVMLEKQGRGYLVENKIQEYRNERKEKK